MTDCSHASPDRVKLNPIYPTAPIAEDPPLEQDLGDITDRKFMDYTELTTEESPKFEESPAWYKEAE